MVGPSPARGRLSLAVVAILAAALACASVRPPWVERGDPTQLPVVDRIEPSVLRIRWPLGAGPVTVYKGTSPDAIDRSDPVARVSALESSVRIGGLDPFVRHYFEVVGGSGARPWIVAERRLPLDGASNFRDLGGYVGEDQRQIRWGRLYRSDDLARLTRADVRYVQGLDIRLVCDLRSSRERESQPNRSTGAVNTTDASVTLPALDPTAIREQIRTGRISAPELERTMIEAYESLVVDHSDAFAQMFERIADPANLPSVLHCTAGKDRTGFASALFLLALGVDEETVYDDYLRTNQYQAGSRKWQLRLIRIYSLFRTDPAELEPLLEARRPYLDASLDTIRERWGSLDAYFEGALGLTPERRARLERTFLE